MIHQKETIFTGGSGLLGSEMEKLFPDIIFPPHEEFDVTNYDQMEEYVGNGSYRMVIHAAAFISPPKIEQEPLKAVEVNVIGTANIVKLCMRHNLKLVYISTDYVFKGDAGGYSEEDPMFPVNKYAWSKLGGECAVRLYDNSVIIRTSFGPNKFPYKEAFIDQWTSRESVSEVAKKIARIVNSDFRGVIHVGGRKKTVYEYAKGLDPQKEVGELSIEDVPFEAPSDTSLNCDKYNDLFKEA
ncbi:MAG: sugar nucleotide-binding protein [Candidatus Brennerbacteria bacterium]